MTSTRIEFSNQSRLDPQKEYRVLLRSLRYTEGFGLLFIKCSPSEGDRLIARVKQDLPQKHIEVLSLTQPINTLFDKVEQIYHDKPVDVLFVQGIEHSLYDYEKHRLWSNEAQRRSYSETGIPRLLQHLNLSREKFYSSFPFHFVFLVPPFALKYLIRRAPDFFDWNSGVLEFPMKQELLLQESEQSIFERILTGYPLDVTLEECRKSVLRIQALLEEPNQSKKQQLDLLFEQSRLFYLTENLEACISSLDKLLQINPGEVLAWYNRGVVLDELGHYEEATASYDKALQFNPDDDVTWYNRGIALHTLGRYEEAIASYDKALQFNPDNDSAWNNRGLALKQLGRYEEAIASYDKTLERNLKNDNAFYNKACFYALKSDLEEAIANLSQAIALSPDKCRELAKTDSDFDAIRDTEEFKALVFEP
jgi:tetratricopeptide (TPR) repeat protein